MKKIEKTSRIAQSDRCNSKRHEKYGAGISKKPRLYTQFRLSDLIRDFGLDKVRAELLASRFKEDNDLEKNTKI